MLELTSKRATIKFALDGELVEVPSELNAAEAIELAKCKADISDASAAIGWFAEFLRPYIGEKVDGLSVNALSLIMGEWSEAQPKN